jgi:predicted GH43/DUF377 family glycosyl hydrolase
MSLVWRTGLRMAPDPTRVLATLFVPGEEMPDDESRASSVIQRILALDDTEVEATLDDLKARFAERHRRLDDTYREHFGVIAHRLGPKDKPSAGQELLLGAYFTGEYAPGATALTNPSMVEHPDQTGLQPDEVRFVMSLRAIGEGHRSSVEFRTGILGPDRALRVDEPGVLIEAGRRSQRLYEKAQLHAQLVETTAYDETASYVLDGLGPRFTAAELLDSISALHPHLVARRAAKDTIERLEQLIANNYEVTFRSDTDLSERVLIPIGPSESHGMEDARFVRFIDDDGSATYYATYTAYDGSSVAPQLLETSDFQTFRANQLRGPAATNKGMALFPRRVDGKFLTLSRWDRTNNSIAASDDRWTWGQASPLASSPEPWNLIQVGNCGSPIETPAGWLVLTHGVGPMRTYAIGATLLDLEDPRRVLANLDSPFLVPTADERDGYVPNVVYSCGAMRHGDDLVVPYGFGDEHTSIAFVCLPELLDRLRAAVPVG